MILRNYIIVLVFLISLTSCKNIKDKTKTDNSIEKKSSDLKVDHFNIWVENPEKAKKKLTDIGFTSVPDSPSDVHTGQGTAGKYFHFFNGYLELIFVFNQNELEKRLESLINDENLREKFSKNSILKTKNRQEIYFLFLFLFSFRKKPISSIHISVLLTKSS